MEYTEIDNRDLQCIMNPVLAKRLVNLNCIIKDLKPNKNRPNGTVFLFEKSDVLFEEMEKFRLNKK